ncbi:hypothetical protein [Flavobacterium sp. N3904]|uniref:hypothetical protein n=1 Tax=Flavobacterium sp. N3904 TaxID=2986835 RepID=UPI002224E473|nr:hypothetical protein [Flavobacterium sp. N3904]
MKPETTLNLLNDYFANELQNLILFFSFFSNNKKIVSIPSKLFIAILLFFAMNDLYSQSNSCKATLQVEKNRSTQSTPPEGTSYNLQLTNNGVSNATYSLSYSNVNSNCSNNDGSDSARNITLNISFTDTRSNSISEISINPGESVTFIVNITVPKGTAVNKWNCTEISASSTNCATYKTSTILHTLVNDPNQE